MNDNLQAISIRLYLFIFVFTGVLAGCEIGKGKPETEGALVLPEAAAISDFKLNHPQLGEFNNEAIKGKWSLFFFGYTRCPDVCPTELYLMAEMTKAIEKNPSAVGEAPQVVFVSVDPQQDKPEQLQKYASFYHPSFTGVTGEQSEVDSLVKSMGVFYQRVYHQDGKVIVDFDPDQEIPEAIKNTYLINHTASIFLVNPDGNLHAVFGPPHNSEVMIRDIASIQRAW